GHRIKCNPAIKSAADRAAITQALAEGRIDVLATDHAPHLAEEKAQPYARAPSGLPLVQYALQCALERVFDGELRLERVVEAAMHAPAMLFDVRERGFLREGYHADLVLVDPHAPHLCRPAAMFSKCGVTPFDGYPFRATIAATFVNGRLAYRDGTIDDSVRGQRLEFAR